MPLSVGARLGPYEIVAPLGAGGMGEVYCATDMKLKRQVAIKILPAALAGDAERLARFRREAEVLASLNHPHIAVIYGFEDAHDTHALVMALVDGPTLSEILEDSGPRTGRGSLLRQSERTMSRGSGSGLPGSTNRDCLSMAVNRRTLRSVKAVGGFEMIDAMTAWSPPSTADHRTTRRSCSA